MTRLLLAILVFYRRWLSPALHSLNPGGLPLSAHLLGVCIASPSPPTALCAVLALALWRLLRCNPFARGGLDPVPPDTTLAPTPDAKPFRPTNRYHRKSG